MEKMRILMLMINVHMNNWIERIDFENIERSNVFQIYPNALNEVGKL